jgi:hypothetical protein
MGMHGAVWPMSRSSTSSSVRRPPKPWHPQSVTHGGPQAEIAPQGGIYGACAGMVDCSVLARQCSDCDGIMIRSARSTGSCSCSKRWRHRVTSSEQRTDLAHAQRPRVSFFCCGRWRAFSPANSELMHGCAGCGIHMQQSSSYWQGCGWPVRWNNQQARASTMQRSRQACLYVGLPRVYSVF